MHQHLSQHPDLALPSDLKEVHFFDLHWDRGLEWYNGLFAGETPGQQRWEATPNYLYIDNARERIQQTLTNPKFVVLLRDPPARSLSHYRRYVANTDRTATFSNACAARRNLVRYSQYSEFLPAYFETFGREAFLVLFYEDIASRPVELLREVTDFMGLEPMDLSEDVLRARVNEAPAPRFPRLHVVMEKSKRWLNRSGLGRIVDVARSSGLRKLVTGGKANHVTPPLGQKDAELLETLRHKEIAALKALNIDASHWAGLPLPK